MKLTIVSSEKGYHCIYLNDEVIRFNSESPNTVIWNALVLGFEVDRQYLTNEEFNQRYA